ncbi:trace amine-associated receptor 1-like [Coccinella septempunctata]|uniref:trace amine-associated receptor 1-like n=1 Tax=Coccinella septempunctata TaxID=41139 RepID=UPI001D05E24C|nr:trace amine-associated receptor 1-like [Coccinella septempunctata]XP_044747071.1 trace amine-associated receptor 1-like [Coccinella septempunctata]
MDVVSFNNTNQALLYNIYIGELPIDNISDSDVNITKTITRLTSPLAVTIAVMLVFLFSPMILVGNSLVLVAMYRFKRLRTPSNYLIMSLATSDLGIGMFMPIGMYLELGGAYNSSNLKCLFSYGVAITLCCVSVLVMVAIAVDRFTSLARPLRYNNLITHSAVERYIAVFWTYSSLVGFSPLLYTLISGTKYSRSEECSFGGLVAKPVQLFMFCAVYGPSALVLLVCYGYIYFVARGHARAISTERHSIPRSQENETPTAVHPRYGLALAITAGMFLGLWLPFQICMLIDVFIGTNILSAWISVYLALPILASSAFNPWIYGYRNSELRTGVRRVIDDLLTAFGFTYRSQQVSDPIALSAAATAGDHASFIHYTQRECVQWKPNGDFLLVPIARPESSGVVSESDLPNMFRENPKILITSEPPRMLKGSRSMVETFAITRGSDILIIKGRGMLHGASII